MFPHLPPVSSRISLRGLGDKVSSRPGFGSASRFCALSWSFKSSGTRIRARVRLRLPLVYARVTDYSALLLRYSPSPALPPSPQPPGVRSTRWTRRLLMVLLVLVPNVVIPQPRFSPVTSLMVTRSTSTRTSTRTPPPPPIPLGLETLSVIPEQALEPDGVPDPPGSRWIFLHLGCFSRNFPLPFSADAVHESPVRCSRRVHVGRLPSRVDAFPSVSRSDRPLRRSPRRSAPSRLHHRLQRSYITTNDAVSSRGILRVAFGRGRGGVARFP